jgi:hypothetical protein
MFGSAGARVCRVLSSVLAQNPHSGFGWIPAAARVLRVIYERDRLQLADTLAELAKAPPMSVILAFSSASDCRIIGEALRGQSPERIARILSTIWMRDRSIRDLCVLFPTSIQLRRAVRELGDPAWEDMGLLLSTLRDAGRAQRIEASPDAIRLDQQTRRPALAELDGTPALPGLRFFLPETAGDLQRLGRQLENCLGNSLYAVEVATGRAYVVALIDDFDAPKYVLEIDDEGKILQSSGHRNEPMEPGVRQVVERTLAKRLGRARDARSRRSLDRHESPVDESSREGVLEEG